MKNKNFGLFIALCLVICFAPLLMWEVDNISIRGALWRVVLLSTFGIGYHWNKGKPFFKYYKKKVSIVEN